MIGENHVADVYYMCNHGSLFAVVWKCVHTKIPEGGMSIFAGMEDLICSLGRELLSKGRSSTLLCNSLRTPAVCSHEDLLIAIAVALEWAAGSATSRVI